jgi:hypothetical protein
LDGELPQTIGGIGQSGLHAVPAEVHVGSAMQQPQQMREELRQRR